MTPLKYDNICHVMIGKKTSIVWTSMYIMLYCLGHWITNAYGNIFRHLDSTWVNMKQNMVIHNSRRLWQAKTKQGTHSQKRVCSCHIDVLWLLHRPENHTLQIMAQNGPHNRLKTPLTSFSTYAIIMSNSLWMRAINAQLSAQNKPHTNSTFTWVQIHRNGIKLISQSQHNEVTQNTCWENRAAVTQQPWFWLPKLYSK